MLQTELLRITFQPSDYIRNSNKKLLDKDWGLTDCISFVIMQKERITEAFTTDKHFEQAGFIRLIK